MLISFNWLKQHINLPDSVSAADVAAKLKASTVEVEKIEMQGQNLENVVVGKVLSAEKHPNADKLKVCTVDVGGEQLSIVCGGSNVNKGMLVALAKIGAKVKWHGEGDLVELKPVAIRGVESAGMICASTEIGLAEMFPLSEEKEILDLSNFKVKPGVALAKALGLDDAILEIDNKSLSNRPDLWGHYGIAREVAVLYGKKLKQHYEAGTIEPGKDISLNVEVKDAKLCPRYMAVAMSGINVAPSPQWLQKTLLSVGQRPINNIVDITNYIMMDLGQPMHAFDASRVANGKIVVKTAKDGEEFTTLDGQKRKLDSKVLMIADSEKSLAIAGVMGGLDSGINNDTKTIIFESANFEAGSIRHTSAKLGLRSDSSARFEKSLDPNLAAMALEYAVELVLEICKGSKVASNVADQAKFSLQQGPITMSMEFLHSKMGAKLPKKEAVRILEALGFEVKIKNEELSVIIPSWRATKDISIPEDLVEEIIRIHGFDKIVSQMPVFAINPPEENKLLNLERRCKNILVNSLAYTEVYNYSFVSPQSITKLGQDVSQHLELENPLSQERPFLRRHLMNNLLENVKKNIDDYPELRLFEVGKRFLLGEPGARITENSNELLPRQDTWLHAIFASKKDKNPFWEARRAAEAIFADLNKEFKLEKNDKLRPWQHPSRNGKIMVGSDFVGRVFEFHPMVVENFGLECAVSMVSLNLDELAKLSSAVKKYAPIAEFPSAERDLAISVKKDVAHADILAALLGADPLLHSVELFDVYEGKGVGENYKSMAYHFVYQNRERTLVTEEVDKAHDGSVKILKEKFGAEVR
ncbi:MAG: phenylalanyl-tRNA synthetase beta chain [Parcubacteria group bacterium Gr01-1014_13]|nr:MAG: phenylalanyl-tRNA synthetase beta chain [Parcubacteria group bacterium Gr01-1014_13]